MQGQSLPCQRPPQSSYLMTESEALVEALKIAFVFSSAQHARRLFSQ
jgi:hypothetical protein